MGVMIAAAAIGAAGAIAGSAISASGARSAAAKAADANSKATADTNALNLDMFNQSRGSTGHAVLPTYFGGNEQAAGATAFENFQNLNSGANAVGSQLLNYQNRMDPSVNASLGYLGDRYNGQDLAARLGYSQPVWDARNAYAQTQGQGLRDVAQTNQAGINIGLMQSLAAQNAQRTAQGYLGGSTFDRNRAIASTIGAQQAAAGQLAQAQATGNNLFSQSQMQNAQERGNFQLSDMDFRSNPGALSTAATNLAAYRSSPYTTMANLYTSAQQPLGFFRIGQQAYNQPYSPQVSPQISGNQVLGAGISAAGQLAQQYFTSQNQPQIQQPQYVGNSPYSSGLMSGYQFNPSGGFATQSFANYNPSSFSNFNAGTGTGNLPAFNSSMPALDYSAYGSTGSTFGSGPTCYVARAVYGVTNPRWQLFREWLLTQAPVSLLVSYVNGGEEFSKLLRPSDKADLRTNMDAILRLHLA